MEAGAALYGPAEASLLHEAQLLVGRDGLLVEIEDAKADAVEAQLLEGVASSRSMASVP